MYAFLYLLYVIYCIYLKFQWTVLLSYQFGSLMGDY